MIRFCKGKLTQITPRVRWRIVRSCSVQDLLTNWKVQVHVLDQIMAGFLLPELERGSNRHHSKGTKRDARSLAESYMHIRLHRLGG